MKLFTLTPFFWSLMLGVSLLAGCNPPENPQSNLSITSISPLNGAQAGGGTLTILGSGLELVNSVTVGGNTCTDLNAASGSVTCTLPAGSPGPQVVVVRNVARNSATSPDMFTYTASPIIASVSPASGPSNGGTPLIITGSNFVSGASVRVGGADCTPVTFVDSNELECVTGTGPNGLVSVVVTNPDTQQVTSTNAFTYISGPIISTITPSGGPLGGSGGVPTADDVVITGLAFENDATVSIGGNNCPVIARSGSTGITCQPPAGAVGAQDVVVTNVAQGLSRTRTGGYTYAAAPTVGSILPVQGPMSGGMLVTITGTGFMAGMSFDLGTSPCLGVSVTNSTTATCTTTLRGAAGPVAVTATNPYTQSNFNADLYTYRAPPTISGIAESERFAAGGQTITINGLDFFNTPSIPTVLVNGATCTGVSFVTSSQLTCTTPSGSGAATVMVINPDGQSASQTSAFTYIVAPSISSVSPNIGPVIGGNTITINGSGFRVGLTIRIGAIDCTTSTYVSAGSATCVVPDSTIPAALTQRSVTVTNTDTQTITNPNAYTYRPAPEITLVAPIGGSPAGGTAVTITGDWFFAGANVQINGEPCPINTITQTSITCTAPAFTGDSADLPLSVNVQVFNNDDQASNMGAFTYRVAPVISSVVDREGPPVGVKENLTINGDHFNDPSVSIDGVPCVIVGIPTAIEIVCTPGDDASVVTTPSYRDIVVTNSDMQSVSRTGTEGYLYQAAPVVDSISPAIGPATLTDPYSVTIAGENFSPTTGLTVSIGGVPCTVTGTVTSDQIECSLGDRTGSDGTVDVVVTNADGQTDTLAGEFTYRNPPTITFIDASNPGSGPATGTPLVRIEGTNFYDNNMEIRFGGELCTGFTYVGLTEIDCNRPEKLDGGAVDVTVRNLDHPDYLNHTATLVAGYEYILAPVITSVQSAGAPVAHDNIAENDVITITGTDFNAGLTVVEIGGVPCAGLSVTPPTITCTVPAGSGAENLVVENPDGQQSTWALEYRDIPTIDSVTPDYLSTAAANPVEITIVGTHFYGASNQWTVMIGAQACVDVIVADQETITCRAPTHLVAGPVDVVVRTTTQLESTLVNGFTYLALPTFATVVPGNRAETGAAPVSITITGTNFFLSTSDPSIKTKVFLNNEVDFNECTNVVVDPSTTSLTCDAPPSTTGGGLKAIILENPDGSFSNNPNEFTYTPRPVISESTQQFGPRNGGNTLQILGSNFDDPGAVVDVSPVCLSQSVFDSTEVRCDLDDPGGADETVTVDIKVINLDLQESEVFEYTYRPAPFFAAPITPRDYGPMAGGNEIIITGQYFYEGVKVKNFTDGEIDFCTPTVDVARTELTCTVPSWSAGPTTKQLYIENIEGQRSVLFNYAYVPAPTFAAVDPITPNVGSVDGGDIIDIFGTDFIDDLATIVRIDDVPCITTTWVDATHLECLTPPGTPGPKPVTVTNPDGQIATLNSGFIYLAPPLVTSVSPNNGSTVGGDVVSVAGNNFFPGATVSIGGIACTPVTFVNTGLITCTTTASGLSSGAYGVTVTNVNADFHTLPGAFYFRARPTISSISPPNGSLNGGTVITIGGSGFSSGVTVQVGGNLCTNVSLSSCAGFICGQIQCTTPAGASGAVAVRVTNLDGQFDEESPGFVYDNPAPTVTGITPTNGTTAGGQTVTISGTNFSPSVSVTIAGIECGSSTVNLGLNQIQCTTGAIAPGSAGLANVVVTNLDDQVSTGGNDIFQYVAPPVYGSVSPVSGTSAGGTVITVEGQYFVSGSTAVSVGGAPCTGVSVSSATSLTCTTPAGTAGARDIVITKLGGLTATGTGVFTYLDIPVLEWQVGGGSPNPPNPADYGEQTVNVTFTYTLKNVGTADSDSVTVSMSGDIWTFSKINDFCTGFILPAGSECTVDVTFNPAFTESYEAILRAEATPGGFTENVLQGSAP